MTLKEVTYKFIKGYDTERDMTSTEVLYIEFEDGNDIALTNTNILLGMCDDCTDWDLHRKKVKFYKLMDAKNFIYKGNNNEK